MASTGARSILDYLTIKNPDLDYYNEDNATQTTGHSWRAPVYLQPWREFEFDQIMRIFDGKLKTEILRPRTDLPFVQPPLENYQRKDNSEETTKFILSRWTFAMVSRALKAVETTLNPAFFVPSSLANSGSPSTTTESAAKVDERLKERAQPERECKIQQQERNRTKLKKGGGLRPDGAAIILDKPPPDSHAATSSGRTSANKPPLPDNRLPHDIKPGCKWHSSILESYVDKSSGKWLVGKSRSNLAKPIRQIYSYCLEHKARYGCIITSKEILIVRIKPYKTPRKDSKKPSSDASREEDELLQALHDHGLMEYKSIPWSAHGDGKDPTYHKELTVNLTLWILHVLAGNNHKVGWDYLPLHKETLRKRDIPGPALSVASSFTEATNSFSESEQNFLGNLQEADTLHLSFASNRSLNSTGSRKRRNAVPDAFKEEGRPRTRRRVAEEKAGNAANHTRLGIEGVLREHV
ncbi:hypothetical protein AAE478_000537 [Parahypoxylon ruwenzoriense]